MISHSSHSWTLSLTLALLETSKSDRFLALLGGTETVSPYRSSGLTSRLPVQWECPISADSRLPIQTHMR